MHKLAPSRPHRNCDWLLGHLQRLDLGDLLPCRDTSPEAIALRAGLYQWHDYLDESHACSQQIEGEGRHHLGDHWHAIMHRREPDYGNSQYWFRRVGRSPIFPELATRAATHIQAKPQVAGTWLPRLLPRGEWDACAFVDLCEAAANDSTLCEIAETIQELEMELLFATTLHAAQN